MSSSYSLSKILSGVDHILLATGYRYSYPFLPIYHNSSLGVNDTAPADGVQPIVTDGTPLAIFALGRFLHPRPHTRIHKRFVSVFRLDRILLTNSVI